MLLVACRTLLLLIIQIISFRLFWGEIWYVFVGEFKKKYIYLILCHTLLSIAVSLKLDIYSVFVWLSSVFNLVCIMCVQFACVRLLWTLQGLKKTTTAVQQFSPT